MAKFRTFFLCCCRMVWVSHITAVGEVYPKLFSVHRLREMKVNFVLCLFLSLLLLLLFCYCYCFFVIFCLHWIFNTIMLHWSLNFEFAFSVLTLLVWHEKEHSACKKIKWWGVEVMGCGNLSGVRCRFAYGPADAQQMPCHCIPKPCYLLPYSNPDWSYLSGTGLSRFSKNKWPLNGCSVVIVSDLWMLCIFILP